MKNQLKKKLKYVKIWKRGDKMLTYSKDDFDESLEDIIKSEKRENAGKTLPPQGLYLVKVEYAQ